MSEVNVGDKIVVDGKNVMVVEEVLLEESTGVPTYRARDISGVTESQVVSSSRVKLYLED